MRLRVPDLIAFLAGALLCVAALDRLEASTAGDRAEDDPPDVRKILVLRGACWTGTSDAWYEPSRDALVADAGAGIASMMNFVLRGEHGVRGGVRAYSHGVGGVDVETHLASLRSACAVPGAAAVVYVNAPGALQSFTDARRTLAAERILATIAAEGTAASPHAAEYLAILRRSGGYAEAVRSRARIELSGSYAESLRLDEAARHGAHPADTWMARQAAKLWRIRRGWLPGAGPEMEDRRTLALLDRCATSYDHPGTRRRPLRRPLPEDLYWAPSGGAYESWLRLAVELCRERGVRFVYYVPPHLQVTPAEYAAHFGPGFVERVRKVLAAYPGDAVLVDHALDRTAVPADLSWFATVGGVEVKPGYLFNAIGQYRRCRVLLRSLAGIEGLGVPPPAGDAAWPGEAALPRATGAVEYVPEALSAKALEAVFQPETLRLTRPAEE